MSRATSDPGAAGGASDTLVARQPPRQPARQPARQPEPREGAGASLLDGGPAAPARTLQDVFGATVAAWPERVALDDGITELTYAELDGAARRLAASLGSAGLGRGDRVGVQVPDGTAELYVAILGTLLAGAAYVPVDAGDPPARAGELFEESAVAAVVGEGLQIAHRRPGGGLSGPAQLGDDAWVIFTSGSTGRPKGVAVTHRSAAAFVDAEAAFFEVGPADRVLAALSVGFDASCEEMWLAWRNGAALVPAPRCLAQAGSDLGRFVASRRVTVVSTVPTLAAMWDERDLAGVRLLVLGGEACPAALANRLAAGREVWNTYGPTEATVVATLARLRPGQPVLIGRPLPGWRAAVVDAAGRPVPPGEAGELVLGGIGLARYLDASLDDQRFGTSEALGWGRAYRTGDLARSTPAGLDYLGRADDQVKLGGRRIELGEVEARLSAVPGVLQAAAALRRTAAGDPVLVGYVTGGVEAATVREELGRHLPAGVVPVVVGLASMPVSSAGKVDRAALPWPPPADGEPADWPEGFGPTERYLAEVWQRHLGVRPRTRDDDFFALGGASLAAARVASELRGRYVSFAVAELYTHRSLAALAARLDALEVPVTDAVPAPSGRPARGVLQLAGLAALLGTNVPGWLIVLLAIDDWTGARALPRLGWGWLLLGWLAFLSAPGRVLLVAGAQRLLVGRLAPGRYPRRSFAATRVWFVARLADQLGIAQLGGTPFAVGVARLTGTAVGTNVSLGTVPVPGGRVSIATGATIESDADVCGWHVEGPDLVVGTVEVGAGARVGARALLMPGARLGEGAEVEAGSVVTGDVPAGQRFAGSPARHVGPAGTGWPAGSPPPPRQAWRWAYGASLLLGGALVLAALVPGYLVAGALGYHIGMLAAASLGFCVTAPLFAASFVLSYAVLVALAVRAVGRLVRPGWHGGGRVAWAAWTAEHLLASSRTMLFPLYSTIYTRCWLRLAGLGVGRRTELSTAIGLGPLVTLADAAFVADDVVFDTGRSRNGWLHLEPIGAASGVFIGNGALLHGGTRLGADSLVGVQSTPPRECPAGSSWFGVPALEFPRPPRRADPRRTVAPTRGLVAARLAMDAVRVLLPTSASVALAMGVLAALGAIGARLGLAGTAGLALPVTAAAGVIAVALTAMVKWALIGRYRAGEHPLWSAFVWRDEIVNSSQELLAGDWLLDAALGTPVVNWYLRLMGARVGADVWCDTLTITEFEMVRIADGVAMNRRSCIETHLFQDRVMSIGPIELGAGCTVGPSTAVLPETVIGAGCVIGGRSVVLRGEELPARSRWHGAPVVAP